MADVIVLSDLEAIAQEAAERWVQIASIAVEERGSFSIALAGGSTPRVLYSLMASSAYRDQVPWGSTYVFWGDERRVAHDHEDSNYHMAYESLLRHVPIPHEQIFRMDGQKLARSAASDYEYAIQRHFGLGRREFPRFDLILLGLGEDAHTASIFPGTRGVTVRDQMVVVYEVPQILSERMTLTLPVLNNARHLLFMVAGENKAEALYHVLHGEKKTSTYPAQAIQPEDGTLTYLVDEAAASRLPQ